MTIPNHHASQRFIAPSTVQHRVPLKELMGRKLIALIPERPQLVQDDDEE